MTSIVVRPMVAEDRAQVLDIVTRAGNFTRDEITVAMELVDLWLAKGEVSDYIVDVLDDASANGPRVRGYVCFGPAPMTEGTYDLYWIAVDPDQQGRGLGRQLLASTEDKVRARGGRLLLIETASQDSYAATVRFYERAGYVVVSRIADYYRVGDDKLVFAKRVAP